MRTGEFDSFICLDDDTEIDVVVEWSGYYQRAKISGPMEDCYPAEGEVTIEDVDVKGEWPEGLSKAEFDRAVTNARERFMELAWDECHACE